MKDSFEKAPAEIGTVKTLRIILNVTEGDEGNQYTAEYDFVVPEDDHRHGDLIPYLTAQRKTAIKGFMDAMLIKAQGAGN